MRNIDWDRAYGPSPDAFHTVLVHAIEREEKPMKRKFARTALIAALLLFLLAATALAVGLTRSVQYDAIRTAKEALCEKYGLTLDTLGLFMGEAEQEDGSWTITFQPAFLSQNPMGTYTVLLRDGEPPEAAWTYDGVDLEALAGQGLDAPAWGQAQLAQALAIDREHNRQIAESTRKPGDGLMSLQERAQRDAILQEASEQGLVSSVMSIVPREGDITEEEAIAYAEKLIYEKYGIDSSYLDQYVRDVNLYLYADNEQARYTVGYMLPADGMPGVYYGIFYVDFRTPSGRVDACLWQPRDPADRTLPDGPLDAYEEAVEEYVEEGSFALLAPEDKMAVAERIVQAGMGDLIGNLDYDVPDISTLTQEEALIAANEALLGTPGFTEDTLALFGPTSSFIIEEGQPKWIVEYRIWDDTELAWEFRDKIGAYTVRLNADEGNMESIEWSLDGEHKLETYTAQTWGEAPAYESYVLPWMLALDEARREMLPDGKSEFDLDLEGMAAYDQLFRDAGFPADMYRNALPKEGDLSLEEAQAITQEALREEYGLTDEQMDGLMQQTYFCLDGPDARRWVLQLYQQGEGNKNYFTLSLDAATGEVLDLEYVASGNG